MNHVAFDPSRSAAGDAVKPGAPGVPIEPRHDPPASDSRLRAGDHPAERKLPAGRDPVRPTALLLTAGAIAVLVPLWVPLLLAAWFASLVRGPYDALARRLGGRHWAAALVTLLLVVAMLLPFAVIALSVASNADELWRRASSSKSVRDLVTGLVSQDGTAGGAGSTAPGGVDAQRLLALAREHGQRGLATLRTVTGTAADVVIDLFVFLFGAYAWLVDGPRHYRWAVDHAPLARRHVHRLANAFQETGRGLVVGVGLTALVQAAVATVLYLVLRVPQAPVLGLVTFFAALVPTFGTALVWVPVAAGLALSGRMVPALVLSGVGVGLVASVDNLLRPVLARYGKLELPTFVLLTSMFGGLALVGAWGLLLGPLLVRLAKEALRIAREERAWARQGNASPEGAEAP